MQILKSYIDPPDALKGAALAIGNFDGVHRGHQAVLAAAVKAGRAKGRPCGVMTFEPHPRQFFQPDAPLFRLTPEPLKLRLMAALGLDVAIVLPFNAALAALTAEQFVSTVLVEGLAVDHVVTGSDFHFGKGRKGTPAMLRSLGKESGFAVTLVEPQGEGEAVYSSTDARQALRDGDPRVAADILGYWWRIAGEVTGGDKRGHGLGFPTANISVPPGFALKHGIYAVRVWVGGERYHGAAYLGTRPSFDDGAPVIETFLFDFSGDLYGQEMELEVIAFLRGDEKFDSATALVAQMQADCEMAGRLLADLDRNDPFAPGLLGGTPDG
jgi:riboflavin kinase/FMN adenylyltransferase